MKYDEPVVQELLNRSRQEDKELQAPQQTEIKLNTRPEVDIVMNGYQDSLSV